MLLQPGIDLISFLGSKMADRTFNQLQVRADRLGADILDGLIILDAIDFLICSELQIDVVCLVDQFCCPLISQNLRKRSSHIRGEG